MTERQPDSRYQVRSVERALDLLTEVSKAPAPIDLSSVARQVGLHPSTAFRLLETLRSRDMVRLVRNGYVVGARAFEVGNAFLHRVSIWAQAGELAEHLAARVGETASVGILDDDEVLYIAIAHGQREFGIQSAAGTRHPAHATALGKVLLAAQPWPDVQARLQRVPPERLTERTITATDAIRRELERAAEQGYAVDDEERQPGVICIGAPVRDHHDEVVAAVSVSGPAFRITDAGIEDVARQVVTAANDASRLLGASVSRPTLVGARAGSGNGTA